MNRISIFVDESGDFDLQSKHSPYYLLTLLFHEKRHSIQEQVHIFRQKLSVFTQSIPEIHTGPLIRREGSFQHMTIDFRRKLFFLALQFTRRCEFKYVVFRFKKSEFNSVYELKDRMKIKVLRFLETTYSYFFSFDTIDVFYDNGQQEIKDLLLDTLGSTFMGLTFRLVKSADYLLFQVADMLCSCELIEMKRLDHQLSKSEKAFFYQSGEFRRLYKVLSQRKMSD